MDKLSTISIKECTLFNNIESTDFDKIISIGSATAKNYRKGDVIMAKTDGTSRIGIIAAGRITEKKYHIDGSSEIMKIYSRNDIIGLTAATSLVPVPTDTFTADTETTVVFLWYRNLVESGFLSADCKLTLQKNISAILAKYSIDSVHIIDILSHYTTRERIRTFLSIQQETNKSKTFDIAMNQVELAQYLRVNRSVLSNELNTMKKEGLLSFKGSMFTILY